MEIPDAMLRHRFVRCLTISQKNAVLRVFPWSSTSSSQAMTVEKMMEEMKPQALKRIQTRLVLEKIAETREHSANRGRR